MDGTAIKGKKIIQNLSYYGLIICYVIEGASFNDKFLLLSTVADVLGSILKYDTSDILSKERFQVVLHPVVNHVCV